MFLKNRDMCWFAITNIIQGSCCLSFWTISALSWQGKQAKYGEGKKKSPDFNCPSLKQQHQSLKTFIFPKNCSPNARFCMFYFTNGFIVSLKRLYHLSMNI